MPGHQPVAWSWSEPGADVHRRADRRRRQRRRPSRRTARRWPVGSGRRGRATLTVPADQHGVEDRADPRSHPQRDPQGEHGEPDDDDDRADGDPGVPADALVQHVPRGEADVAGDDQGDPDATDDQPDDALHDPHRQRRRDRAGEGEMSCAGDGATAHVAGDGLAGRGDEGVEQALLGGSLGRRVLGMPLHADDPPVGELDAFDDVARPRRDDESGAELVDRLVVDAVPAWHVSCPSPSPSSIRRRRRCRCGGGSARAARLPMTSGRCWCSVPPRATLST